MMTLRFGIITCSTVQSIQMTTLLLLVQIDTSGMFLHWQMHLAIANAFKQHCCVLLCCTTLLKCYMHNTYSSSTCLWGRTWNDLRWRSVYRNPPRSFPFLFPLLLQEACPELSQNEASPLQRSLWDQREDGWVSTSLALSVLQSAQVEILCLCSSFPGTKLFFISFPELFWTNIYILFVVEFI